MLDAAGIQEFFGIIKGQADLMLARINDLLAVVRSGAEGQTRTVDTGIFSAVLYHLSYLGWWRV